MKYEIFEVKEQYEIEQLGTKEKFWIYINNTKHLFKIGRKNTRENLAEKVIYEIGELIDIKVVRYEFAKYKDKLGVFSRSQAGAWECISKSSQNPYRISSLARGISAKIDTK